MEQAPAARLARASGEHAAGSNLAGRVGQRCTVYRGGCWPGTRQGAGDGYPEPRPQPSVGAGWSALEFLGAEAVRRRNVQEARTEQLSSTAQTQLPQAPGRDGAGTAVCALSAASSASRRRGAYLSTRSQIVGRLQGGAWLVHMLRSEGLDPQGYYEAAQNRVAKGEGNAARALQQMGFDRPPSARPVEKLALALLQTCMNPAMLQVRSNTHPALESARYARWKDCGSRPGTRAVWRSDGRRCNRARA